MEDTCTCVVSLAYAYGKVLGRLWCAVEGLYKPGRYGLCGKHKGYKWEDVTGDGIPCEVAKMLEDDVLHATVDVKKGFFHTI